MFTNTTKTEQRMTSFVAPVEPCRCRQFDKYWPGHCFVYQTRSLGLFHIVKGTSRVTLSYSLHFFQFVDLNV